MTKAGDVVEAEVTQDSPESARWLQAEEENQRALALARPRDEAAIYKGALAELDLVPEMAAKAFYSIPYRDGDGKVVPVEGPSIKAAMALIGRWGNQANAFRVKDQDAERVVMQGVCVDYERNNRTLRDLTVPRFYITKDKKRVALNEARMNMAILAGGSKAVRNAIIASLPVFLVEAYVTKAKKIAATLKRGAKVESYADKITWLTNQFLAAGAAAADVKAYIDGSRAQYETEDDHVAHLIGLHNAIKDHQARVSDVFGPEKNDATPEPKEKPAAKAAENAGGFTTFDAIPSAPSQTKEGETTLYVIRFVGDDRKFYSRHRGVFEIAKAAAEHKKAVTATVDAADPKRVWIEQMGLKAE